MIAGGIFRKFGKLKQGGPKKIKGGWKRKCLKPEKH